MDREQFGRASRLRRSAVRRFAEELGADPAVRMVRPDPAFRAELRSRLVAAAAAAATQTKR